MDIEMNMMQCLASKIDRLVVKADAVFGINICEVLPELSLKDDFEMVSLKWVLQCRGHRVSRVVEVRKHTENMKKQPGV